MKMHHLWYVLFILFSSIKIYVFDVKVLLDRYNIDKGRAQEFVITSEHGFIVSSHPKLALGVECKSSQLSIGLSKDHLVLNNKNWTDKIVHLYSILAPAQKKEIAQDLNVWLENNHVLFYQKADKIHELFEKFVVHNFSLDAQHCPLIWDYFVDIASHYIQSMLHDCAISQQAVTQLIQDYIVSLNKTDLIDFLIAENISPDYQKMLKKDHHKRTLFFENIMHQYIKKRVYELIIALPSHILQYFLCDRITMISYQEQQYAGSFIVYKDSKNILLINNLDIDDYLLSVVRHEGFPGWPLEMNKVLAVASRTYLVYQVLEAQKLNRAYHIENGIKHQTYKGFHHCDKIAQAIDQTRDIVIGYNGLPACTMYDVCCGGIVPAHIDDPGFNRISYLSRKYPCTFCKNCKSYSWKLDLSAEQLINRLSTEFPKLKKINDMYVLKKDKAGLVKKIMIVSPGRKIIITEKKFKSFFGQLRSYCFDIMKAHRHFIIEGKGFGHHKGLCQWGALHLVKYEHWNFVDVLQFYYPDTTLMKLSYKI